MKKIIILNADNVYKQKTLYIDNLHQLFLELLNEAFLAQFCLDHLQSNIARKSKNGCETISIRFDILDSEQILLTSVFDKNKEQKIEMSFNFLQKIVTDWLKFDESQYKKIILYIDIDKEVFQYEGFKELSPEDEKLLK